MRRGCFCSKAVCQRWTRAVSAAQGKGNGAAKNAEAAKHDDCVDDIAYKDHEAAFRAYAANLQKDAEDQDDCAAHQHIHAKMEGIGAIQSGWLCL